MFGFSTEEDLIRAEKCYFRLSKILQVSRYAPEFYKLPEMRSLFRKWWLESRPENSGPSEKKASEYNDFSAPNLARANLSGMILYLSPHEFEGHVEEQEERRRNPSLSGSIVMSSN